MKMCVFCGKKFDENNMRNSISEREAKISSLCQECQDEVFGKD